MSASPMAVSTVNWLTTSTRQRARKTPPSNAPRLRACRLEMVLYRLKRNRCGAFFGPLLLLDDPATGTHVTSQWLTERTMNQEKQPLLMQSKYLDTAKKTAVQNRGNFLTCVGGDGGDALHGKLGGGTSHPQSMRDLGVLPDRIGYFCTQKKRNERSGAERSS